MSRRSLVGVWCAAALVAGASTLVLTLLLGGGAPPPAPPGLPDEARLQAWGGAIVTFVSLVVGVVTVGLGLLATGALDRRRPELRSGAASAATLWASITLLHIGLVMSELRGRADVLESSRVQALLVQLALVLACAAAFALAGRLPTTEVAVVLALAALLPVVLAGHASSADRPWLAGVSVSAHVVGAAVWVGGLAGLGWLATMDEDEWSGALPRYSRLALICVVGLTAFGSIATFERLDSPRELLTSRYGAIVLLKVVLLCGLVGAGWLQRRRAFDDQAVGRRPFVMIAGFELFTMTLALALAAALSRTPPPG
jgi:putative copper resistance protein D